MYIYNNKYSIGEPNYKITTNCYKHDEDNACNTSARQPRMVSLSLIQQCTA